MCQLRRASWKAQKTRENSPFVGCILNEWTIVFVTLQHVSSAKISQRPLFWRCCPLCFPKRITSRVINSLHFGSGLKYSVSRRETKANLYVFSLDVPCRDEYYFISQFVKIFFQQQRNQFIKFFYLLTVFKIIFQRISKFILVTRLGYKQNKLIRVCFITSVNTFPTLLYTPYRTDNMWSLNQRRCIRSYKIKIYHKIHKDMYKSLLYNAAYIVLWLGMYDKRWFRLYAKVWEGKYEMHDFFTISTEMYFKRGKYSNVYVTSYARIKRKTTLFNDQTPMSKYDIRHLHTNNIAFRKGIKTQQ